MGQRIQPGQSTRDISSTAIWGSSVPSVTRVSASGLVSSAAVGTSTVAAQSGTVKGSATVVVTAGTATESILHTFFGPHASDGLQPSNLLQASDGNFYGTTLSGGNSCLAESGIPIGCGTVFKITPDGVETVLYLFGASPSDGWGPGGLIQATDGNFYGTTSGGGANSCRTIPGATNNCGTVFKITPAGIETVLYSFGAARADGFAPLGQLIQATDGNLYGTTVDGGPYENPGGIAYRITPDGVETTLYSFGASESDGVRPVFLMQARDGKLYGVTDSGGGEQSLGGATVVGGGTVFELTP